MEPSPSFLFFFTQPPVAQSFVSSPLVIHLLITRRSRLRQFVRYLEPCAEDDRFPVTFRAAMRLLSSKGSALLRTKALRAQHTTVSPITLPSLLSRQPTQESCLRSISQICIPGKSFLARHLASGSLVGALGQSVSRPER